jgi:DNA topoisomerase-1
VAVHKVRVGVPDEKQSAAAAGLRYMIPSGQGIRRKRAGKGFVYLGSDDRPLRDEKTIERIRTLVLPPAWTSVWISPYGNTHIQAVGRDARGRKQYRYHTSYRQMRDLVKFDRMREFGKALPRIRRALNRDLRSQGMTKEKILAAVVKLLETTYIRVGNEEYAEENGSFGLTTLRNRHVQVLGETLEFRFRGKSGQNHEIKLTDPRLARILRKCKDMPGSALFQWQDKYGELHTVESGDVNEYLREISGGDFTAKDFRTWGGTCLAAGFLLGKCADATAKKTKAALVDVVKEVACKLGNKPATCKKYYIHPIVMDCYSSGNLSAAAERFRNGQSVSYERLVLSLLTPLKRLQAKVA